MLSRLGKFTEIDPEAVIALAEGVDAIAAAVQKVVLEKIASVDAKHLISVANSAMKVPITPERLAELHATALPGVMRCLREKKFQPPDLAQLSYAFASSTHGSEEFYRAIVKESEAKIRLFKPSELALVAYSLANAGRTDPAVLAASKVLLGKVASEVEKNPSRYDFEALSNVVRPPCSLCVCVCVLYVKSTRASPLK